MVFAWRTNYIRLAWSRMIYAPCVVYILKIILTFSLTVHLVDYILRALEIGKGIVLKPFNRMDFRKRGLSRLDQHVMIAIYTSTIYYIWQCRNEAIWNHCVRSPTWVLGQIKQDISHRCIVLNIEQWWKSCFPGKRFGEDGSGWFLQSWWCFYNSVILLMVCLCYILPYHSCPFCHFSVIKLMLGVLIVILLLLRWAGCAAGLVDLLVLLLLSVCCWCLFGGMFMLWGCVDDLWLVWAGLGDLMPLFCYWRCSCYSLRLGWACSYAVGSLAALVVNATDGCFTVYAEMLVWCIKCCADVWNEAAGLYSYYW